MSGPALALALRRRSFIERRVVALMRGNALPPQPGRDSRPRRGGAAGLPTAAQVRCFAALRHHAMRHGFRVLDPAAPYMSPGELALLGWLAAAQRTSIREPVPADDPDFRAAIERGAAVLDDMGLRLSIFTLYGARLRDMNGELRGASATGPARP